MVIYIHIVEKNAYKTIILIRVKITVNYSDDNISIWNLIASPVTQYDQL